MVLFITIYITEFIKQTTNALFGQGIAEKFLT